MYFPFLKADLREALEICSFIVIVCVSGATRNSVSCTVILYRDQFGSVDHSDQQDSKNLMALAPVLTLKKFSDKEILILRGYKK